MATHRTVGAVTAALLLSLVCVIWVCWQARDERETQNAEGEPAER